MISTQSLLFALTDSIVLLQAGKEKLSDEQLEKFLEQIKRRWLVERPLRLHNQN